MAVDETRVHTIGIIGGGRSGHAMLRFLLKTHVANVVFMMDPEQGAPGMLEAKNQKIPTFTKLSDALRQPFPEFIFEVTTNDEIDETLKHELAGSPTRIINQTTSRMIVELVEDNRAQIQMSVSEAVQALKNDLLTTLKASQGLVYKINRMTSSMTMLALNATIEATKVGRAGRGFAVVADNMTRSVESVRKLTQEIHDVNTTLTTLSGDIDSVLDLLK